VAKGQHDIAIATIGKQAIAIAEHEQTILDLTARNEKLQAELVRSCSPSPPPPLPLLTLVLRITEAKVCGLSLSAPASVGQRINQRVKQTVALRINTRMPKPPFYPPPPTTRIDY
jgi:hypothetical protein